MRAMSESSSRSAARKAASPSESTESAAAAAAPASTSPTPSAATTLAQYPDDPPENPAPRHHQEKDDESENPADGDVDAGWFAQRPPNPGGGTGQGDPKLLRKRLGNEVHAERQTLAIVLRGEERHHGIADPAGARVGEEPLGTAAHGDEDVAGPRLVILPRHEQHDHAEVLGAVTGLAFGTDAPLAADLHRHVARGAVADVRQRHDDDFAARLLAHLGDHRLHVLYRRPIEDAREVVDETARRWNGDLEEKRDEDQRVRRLRRARKARESRGLMTYSSNFAAFARRRFSSPL